MEKALPAPHRAAIPTDGGAVRADTRNGIVGHTEVGGSAADPAGRAVLGIVIDRITDAATNAGKRRGYRHGAAKLAIRIRGVNLQITRSPTPGIRI
jgi:hypothetical protein